MSSGNNDHSNKTTKYGGEQNHNPNKKNRHNNNKDKRNSDLDIDEKRNPEEQLASPPRPSKDKKDDKKYNDKSERA